MKVTQYSAAIAFAVLSSAALNVSADAEATARTVLLRTSCSDGANGTLNNCFETANDLTDWIIVTRNPTAASPLTVEIGPGDFGRLVWDCSPGQGHVSFRGAGRGRTLFTNTMVLGSAIIFDQCEKLTVQDLTLTSEFIGVTWAGGGSSTWNNVEIQARYGTWYETPAGQWTSGSVCGGPGGTHKWFSSSLILTNPMIGATGFLNVCGKNWFWGTEIVIDAPSATYTGPAVGIKSAGNGHEVHLYGSNVRVISGAGSAISSLKALDASSNAQIHVHGTGIDVIAAKPLPIVALSAASGGEIHANESAYVLKTAAGSGGSVTRISNNGGHVHAPYLWEHVPNTDGDANTIDSNFYSVNGADQTTVTVGTSDGHPHTAIYSASCTDAARWYDTVDKVCRSQ